MTDKDPALLDVLARLRADLGSNAFDIVDWWDADLLATGIASPRDHSVLVYIAVLPHRSGVYVVECERSTEPGDRLPYRVVGRPHEATYTELVETVRRHLATA